MGFEQAWLSYRLNEGVSEWSGISRIDADSQSQIMTNAVSELQKAFREITETDPVLCSDSSKGGGCIYFRTQPELKAEGYHVFERDGNVFIEAPDDAGKLYGAFELIRQMQLKSPLKGLDLQKEPVMPLRMLNHWDNMDGSIERGYSGNSFFFEDNEIIVNERTRDYARLLASVGINGTVINNVNVKDAATWLITDRYFARLKELSEILAGCGIKLFLSLNYAAPVELGELDTADPLSEEVRSWWKERMKLVFAQVPNLGGFLIKADSEGRPGPFTYGRTHADGANMLAEAAEPYGGLIIWRCFVYNCKQDWRDYKTDRARSGYDNFIELDGTFRENVILQIKNGPMDFQVREPVHPLFGGLKAVNQMLEVQIAQEYTGQQRHVCYLIPMFKEVLGFHTYVTETADTVEDIVSGRTFGQSKCGMAAVANTGNDENWTGHDLAAANLYGFGRLAFEPSASAQELAEEWIIRTFGGDEQVREVLLFILMNSWRAYEMYNAPLGIGWMVNPNYHYGPNVDGYEYDRWGTYHRADHYGIGVDRSHHGTGYAGLYREPNASMYDSPESCPDELLLFFHHMPYEHRLKSGKTVIQHIYDTHFEGVELADEMIKRFESLEGKLPEHAYRRMLERFHHQQEHAREWRDQINTYFYRKSGIEDEKKRKIF
ncbi:MAG: alpha-glucuronidase [Lachnospiraceae bacterium]|nr:alpha-glucuronidase [Lachnospiraceae bacterium]